MLEKTTTLRGSCPITTRLSNAAEPDYMAAMYISTSRHCLVMRVCPTSKTRKIVSPEKLVRFQTPLKLIVFIIVPYFDTFDRLDCVLWTQGAVSFQQVEVRQIIYFLYGKKLQCMYWNQLVMCEMLSSILFALQALSGESYQYNNWLFCNKLEWWKMTTQQLGRRMQTCPKTYIHPSIHFFFFI